MSDFWMQNKYRRNWRYGGGRSRYRRGGYKRNYNGGKRSNFTYGNVLDKVVRDVSKLSGLINTEFKVIDTNTTGTISATPSVALINATIQGDDFDNRGGRIIRMKSIQLALTAHMHASATSTFVRCAIVLDKQPNEALPVFADIWSGGATSFGFRNLDGRKRFWILYDQVMLMGDQENAPRHLEFYKKIDAKTVYDDSNVGSIVDLNTNSLMLWLWSSEATNVPTVGRATRVRFVDN